jgi:hypothetical protein
MIKYFDKDGLNCWEPKGIETFKTSKKAVRYFFETQILCKLQFSKKDISERLFTNFPKALKQEAIQYFLLNLNCLSK